MAYTKKDDKTQRQDSPGSQKYSNLKRMFRGGYISVCVYKNVFELRTFYDIVIYRKIRVKGGAYDYRRGTNLKPTDIPILAKLLNEASNFLSTQEDQ